MKFKILQLSFCCLSMFFHSLSISAQTKFAVTDENLKSWVTYLSSDEMKGRMNGSAEMKYISEWLVSQYKESGLKPVLTDGSFIQNYKFTTRQKSVNERNVLGIIEGNNPAMKNQYIIISAHFDHIGIKPGNSPDSVFNGADDNAAGTSTLLGIAKTIKELNLKPGRSLLFAAFSGEESGVRGSKYFVSNSPIPVNSIYVDLNFEMTGHSEFLGKNKYYMTGCRYSNLDEIITGYNKNSSWQLVDTVAIANTLFNSSDNISFSRMTNTDNISIGVPSTTFATTALASYIHSPSDQQEFFDYKNMESIVDYFSKLVIWLSNSNEEIRFTDNGFQRIK
jgi:hypothetical protein